MVETKVMLPSDPTTVVVPLLNVKVPAAPAWQVNVRKLVVPVIVIDPVNPLSKIAVSPATGGPAGPAPPELTASQEVTADQLPTTFLA